MREGVFYYTGECGDPPTADPPARQAKVGTPLSFWLCCPFANMRKHFLAGKKSFYASLAFANPNLKLLIHLFINNLKL
jgi:hypothetical protein